MACAFCQIAKGVKPEEVLYRTERFVVFTPATKAPGKLLIVPIAHYESLADIDIADLSQWLQEARELATKLKVGRYKMQINVGTESSIKHIYMQFNFADRRKEQEASCHPSSVSTGASAQRAGTTAPTSSLGMRRPVRAT